MAGRPAGPPSSAGPQSHLIARPGLWPSSLAGSPGGDSPLQPDSMPAGGESPPSAPRHLDHQWAPPPCWVHPHSPQCWISSRVSGGTTCPTWVLFTVLLSALPLGTGGHCHSNLCIRRGQISPWPRSLLCPGRPRVGSGFRRYICPPGPLGSLLARGPGLGWGFCFEVWKVLRLSFSSSEG